MKNLDQQDIQNASSANSKLCQQKLVENAQPSVRAVLSVPKCLLKFCAQVALF